MAETLPYSPPDALERRLPPLQFDFPALKSLAEAQALAEGQRVLPPEVARLMLANALVERRGGNFGVNVGEWPARPAALRDAAALGLPISDLDPTGLSKTALSSFAPDPKRPQHDRRLLVTPNMNTLDTAKLAVMRLAEAVRRRGTQPADVYADWNGRGSGAQRHAGRVMAMNEALRDPKNQAIRAIYDHLVQTAPRALMQGHRAAENFTPLP